MSESSIETRRPGWRVLAAGIAFVALLLLPALNAGAQGAVSQAIDAYVRFAYDFDQGYQGWTGGFADYPVGFDADYELVWDWRPSAVEGNSVFVSGQNNSADLYMFLQRQVNGLAPNTHYALVFQVSFATNAPSSTSCAGAGGAPGESVIMKAVATDEQPRRIVEPGFLDMVRMSVDKSGLPGSDAVVLGNIAGTSTDCSNTAYEMKVLDNVAAPLEVTTDETGALWLLIGTDSGFEGPTSLYYHGIEVVAWPVEPGDCNADRRVDAGDLTALVLAVFGIDNPLASSRHGCDANEDVVVDAGDLSCLVLLAFEGSGACGQGTAGAAPAAVQRTPMLSLSGSAPAYRGEQVNIQAHLSPGDQAISSLVFSVDYDPVHLSFDPADNNLDGLPDAISVSLPENFNTFVDHDPSDASGKLDLVITSFGPALSALPDGNLVAIAFTANVSTATRSHPVRVTAASFGNTSGQSVSGATADGLVPNQTPTSAPRLFLPFISR